MSPPRSFRPPAPPPATPANAPLKGRGTTWAIAHRFERDAREAFDDGWGAVDAAAGERPQSLPTQVVEEHAGRILAENDSPDIGFEVSLNPYRGCEHGCIYCYARPSHAYLGWSPGLDFESRLVAKVNAAERLRAALGARGYRPRPIAVGTVTDAYQPIERRLGITRAVLEVLHETRHPFSLITKSALVERDLDLIVPMAAAGRACVDITLTTLDPALARRLEPRAASPERRLRTIRTLAEAGVPVGVSVSPLIPFVNEPELERVLHASREAGAVRAFAIVLRLPSELSPLFRHWLELHVPDRAARVMARVQEMRGGRDNDPRFGSRMRGEGVWAELLRQRLHKACDRLGLQRRHEALDVAAFRPPEGAQQRLF
ncbi:MULTISPECIES: PA0069 family radical SAM protein [unclassified Rubrivivax]|uniref:PA0069 family radical SAM protein n=1 Tax=unclassified Rubrivivax TaxID=2649762 RepID=UPI001E3F31AE|nr:MULTISPECIES: PA0069 family radical SAM protein [unclassified Rubrivivax]MCC9597574.1 PA0069 family radical SAM protein [Rubrivivax sp. JA1055]MCC9646168.1 PA0069 family radical SAM protein [Rubrivivax sp. JA1029]